MKKQQGNALAGLLIILFLGVLFIGLIATCMWGYPKYQVYSREMAGRAILAEANFSRQAEVARAQAELDAAQLQADAIRTVGAAAQEFPEYRNQQFIAAFSDAMNNGNISKIIYVPTEANIPITEAGNR